MIFRGNGVYNSRDSSEMVEIERPSQPPFDFPRESPEEKLFVMRERARTLLLELVRPEGILASKDSRFHHYFGRDSFLVAHFIHAASHSTPDRELWGKAKSALSNFWTYQREDGKVRHEIRPFHRGRLLKSEGFYSQMEGKMVNDDSVDATALALIVTPQFIENEEEFRNFLPQAVKALFWITTNMDENKGWLTYRYNKHGLTHQGWMDSKYALMDNEDSLPPDPIALVEVQAYAWKTFQLWADLLREKIPDLSRELKTRAEDLKQRFNAEFLMEDEKGVYFAQALDGRENQIGSVSINPGLTLWASYGGESIIDRRCVPLVVQRLTSREMFSDDCGIQLFEDGQRTYDPESYHSGKRVYWPVANYMVAEGLLNLGFCQEAKRVIQAQRKAFRNFGSFVEQFIKKGEGYSLFRNGNGDGSCRNQTWSIAGFWWEVNQSNSPPL